MPPRTVERICADCIADDDIRRWIRNQEGPSGCDACGGQAAPTVLMEDLAEHMRECISRYFSYAADDLPYDSGEGGYQGATWDTWDILEDLGFEIADDNDDLRGQLANAISDQVWCEYDWTRLEYDVALMLDWKRFCAIVQHRRRFFFHDFSVRLYDDDEKSPSELLHFIAKLIESVDVIKTVTAHTRIYRARLDDGKGPYLSADQLGPPPEERALQANRMNPPGISMMYAATEESTAISELGSESAYVGSFETTRNSRILDLSGLPNPPGFFSGAPREERLGLNFIHEFVREITKPIARDDRTHVDYIPSQVVTEYFRGYNFSDGAIDGIQYPSSVRPGGKNIVLFASPSNIVESSHKKANVGDPSVGGAKASLDRWLRLISAKRV